MATKTFTLMVTITAEDGDKMLDAKHLSQALKLDLETGHCVTMAEVDAVEGDQLLMPSWSVKLRNAANRIKQLHRELRKGV